jgi:putative CocE/NonD family hydrolase
MRDGIRLATDVHGASAEPRPVLLIRTPYGKAGVAPLGEPYVKAGYVLVTQDCRGCFGSEGDVDFLWPEGEDGYDTCAWIVEQPWCNGTIGTYGASWSGWTQTALAALDPPGLAAMVPMYSGAQALQTSVRHHGAVELRFVAWAYWHSALNLALPADVRRRLAAGPLISELLQRAPLRIGETPLQEAPAYARWAHEIATSGEDNERWSHPSVDYLSHADQAAVVPTLLVGGWYDSYARAELQLFQAMRDRGAPVHLVMGPWTHTIPMLSVAGDVDLGPEAAQVDYHQLHLDFFDEHLRTGNITARPPLRLFVMGGGAGTTTAEGHRLHGGTWRDEHEWPLARTQWTTLHLHSSGTLDPAAPTSGASTFHVDPDKPVPTVGGNLSSLMDLVPASAGSSEPPHIDVARVRDLVPAGGWDQRDGTGRPLAERSDVLVFQTPPLVEPVEVTGPISVVLWVSTDAADTDITAKLVDVYPDGYALNLTDSIRRLRYRQGPRAVDYTPGDFVCIDLELYPTSNLFAAGHRIRLDISGSNFPRFDINPGTGDPLWTEEARVRHDITLWHQAEHASRLVLPVIQRAGASAQPHQWPEVQWLRPGRPASTGSS